MNAGDDGRAGEAPQKLDLQHFDAALAGGNPALALEALFTQALAEVRRGAGQAGLAMPVLDEACRRLADRVAAENPTGDRLIGFDRPANLYLVTELYTAGGHRVLLEQMIRARPDERHIVLFTGTLERNRDFARACVEAAGAFAVSPDPQAVLYDKWLWLREKLAAYAARRVFLLHHPEDVVAALAAGEIAPRYGRRMYMLHHADTVGALAATLPGISHIAIRPEQKARMLAARPGLRVTVLTMGLPAPFAPRRKGSAAFARPLATTATCGNEGKFSTRGDLAFPAVICRVLATTQGRHLHIGPVSPTFRRKAATALRRAGIDPDRLVFLGEIGAVSATLAAEKVDLFLASFPVGGNLSLVEAAAAGVPVAIRDPGPAKGADAAAARYASGFDFRPPQALHWTDPPSLQKLLENWPGPEALQEMTEAAQDWARHRHSPDRFCRRYSALITATEGRDRKPLDAPAARARAITPVFDPAFYLETNRDVAAAGMDPLRHFLDHGEAEGRRPNQLFDADWYLDGLPERLRAQAGALPFTHYLLRGEALGYAPHPLFDPTLCAISLSRLVPPAAGAAAPGVMRGYLAAPAPVRPQPHSFFDPDHYAAELALPPGEAPLLLHYLRDEGDLWPAPHPLIAPRHLWRAMGQPGGGPQRLVIDWLTGKNGAGDATSPHPLFQPDHGLHHDAARYGKAAPNLLWAHLIEGNQRGRDPHLLVSVDHVAARRPATLTEAPPLLVALAQNRLGTDTHPLIDSAHIRAQIDTLNADARNPDDLNPDATAMTAFFLEHGAERQIDPHPWFSTVYYLQNYPDLVASGINPLLHFLRYGQYESRRAHPFFDGDHYYAANLKAHGGGSPMVHYAQQGAGRFLATQPQNQELKELQQASACALFAASGTSDPDSLVPAARMLRDALHPRLAPPHPTLVTEPRLLVTDLATVAKPVSALAPEEVTVAPALMLGALRQKAPGGSYAAPPAGAAVFDRALVVPGNDGFGLEDAAGRPLWIDPGLAGFDPATTGLKENAAVVAASPQAVLLRRHGPETRLEAGIFCGGTYSRNYYHFLVEVLPRAQLAAAIAPPGTPILADDDMPAQHYQALRLYLPHNPVLRLPRMRSFRVARLYAASMPNIVQDAFGAAEVAADAIRYHPQSLRALAAIAPALTDRQKPQRLFLWRVSGARRLRNAEEFHNALEPRDFTTANCADLSFADQVRLFAAARAVVGQTGAHLANMLFAPKGTPVFPLYSNAPGSNYALWSSLGALLGHPVVTLVGPAAVGSAGPGQVRAHEDFTVPVAQVLPFFPAGDDLLLEEVELCLAGEGAGADANAAPETNAANMLLQGLATALTEEKTRTEAADVLPAVAVADAGQRQAAWRQRLVALLPEVPDEELGTLLRHPALTEVAARTGDGPAVAATADLAAAFARWAAAADAASPQPDLAAVQRMLLAAMLSVRAAALPLPAGPDALPEKVRPLYLSWLGRGHAAPADLARLLAWIDAQLGRDAASSPAWQQALARLLTTLDLGPALATPSGAEAVLAARARLLARLAPQAGAPRARPRPLGGREGRCRVGLFVSGAAAPAKAVLAAGDQLDPARIEALGFGIGPAVEVAGLCALPADPAGLRAALLAADLDVLIHLDAGPPGFAAADLALCRPVAPAQARLTASPAPATAYPAFDLIRQEADLAEIDAVTRAVASLTAHLLRA